MVKFMLGFKVCVCTFSAFALLACSETDQSAPSELVEDEARVDDALDAAEHTDNDAHDVAEHHDDDEHHDDEHGDDHAGEAHVHGKADLAIVIDEDEIEISLFSPLFNLTGFENEPETPEQLAAFAEATTVLNAVDEQFMFNPEAQCASVSDLTKVDATEHEYRDLEAQFGFRCSNPEDLTRIDVALFDAFPRLEEIEAVILEAEDQSALELTPEAAMIDLRNR